MADDDELGLYLGGSLGSIDARALNDGLAALLKLLGTPPGGRKAETIWALSTLEAGSAAVAVRPGGALTRESVDRFRTIVRGIDQLAVRAGEPEGWGPTDLDNFLKLRKVTGMAGVARASLWLGERKHQVDLRGGVLDNAAASLAEKSVSIGSIRGHLDLYDGRGKGPTVGLRDDLTHRSVRVSFPAEMRAEVLSYIEHDVIVWGELRRNAEGRLVSVVAEGIEEIKRSPAETVESLRGVFGRDWTGGLDSDEFQREQRRG